MVEFIKCPKCDGFLHKNKPFEIKSNKIIYVVLSTDFANFKCINPKCEWYYAEFKNVKVV